MPEQENLELISRPDELIFRTCYAPADLRRLLSSADTRSQIRRLPAFQVFYGLKNLDQVEIQKLLPHLTEEQWCGILDFDLWDRDRMSTTRFLHWERLIIAAEPAVARKLIRATDPEMWELLFTKSLRISARIDEEFEFETAENEDWMVTPDGNYLIVLPKNPDEALCLRALILRLYELEAGWTALLLESARFRTQPEIEESAFQWRTRRIEDLGFQDYYDAIEIYTPLSETDRLPEKEWVGPKELSALPMKLPRLGDETFLLFGALSLIEHPQEAQRLIEELFFVCNKLLSADSISPADSAHVKRGVRKAISGMNLGLDVWANGSLSRAAEGLRRHYLQSFFKLGYGKLIDLRSRARTVAESDGRADLSLFEQAFLKGLLRRYPVLKNVASDSRVRSRYFSRRSDLSRAERHLKRLEQLS